MLSLYEQRNRFESAVDFLRRECGPAPRVALVMGSGLGEEGGGHEVGKFHFSQIPFFPTPSTPGHPGYFLLKNWKSCSFCVFSGRPHYYEGHSLFEVVFPVRCLALWGVETFLLTNAAGAVNPQFSAGDLMLISDHINLMGANPLQGRHLENLGDRFADLSEAYDRGLKRLALACAAELGVSLHEGVYAAFPGPSYETPSEIRMCQLLGVDAVGMSIVPEVIALCQMKRRTAGISCITNSAAGVAAGSSVNHYEVLRVSARSRGFLWQILLRMVERIHEERV
ncbi:MAG: purine-nucleoside phosphorylase [Acidobacteria bacterium]|nr:purine-nucleoside phosphorylase [Acidobacteriota bacterium]